MIMELEELKNMWSEYDRKLDKSLRLNMQLLRQINFDKAKFKIRTLFIIKLFEMVTLMAAAKWLTAFALQNIASPQFYIPAFMLDAMLAAIWIAVLLQISIVIQLELQRNTGAIAPLQKKVERLKSIIVSYLKYALFLIPLYPLMLIVGAKAYLHMDIFELQHRTYLISNLIVALALLPASIWLFRELNKQVIGKRWVKELLSGSGWNQAQAAQQFLQEIEAFEKE